MARIKIDLPDEFVFETLIPVSIADINYGKHLGNDKVLSLMHEARLRFIRSLGYEDETRIGDELGIIIGDVAIVYKAQGYYGDQLSFKLGITDHHKYGFDLVYLLTRISDNKVVAKGKTGTLFYNYKEEGLTKTPEDFFTRLQDKSQANS